MNFLIRVVFFLNLKNIYLKAWFSYKGSFLQHLVLMTSGRRNYQLSFEISLDALRTKLRVLIQLKKSKVAHVLLLSSWAEGRKARLCE